MRIETQGRLAWLTAVHPQPRVATPDRARRPPRLESRTVTHRRTALHIRTLRCGYRHGRTIEALIGCNNGRDPINHAAEQPGGSPLPELANEPVYPAGDEETRPIVGCLIR